MRRPDDLSEKSAVLRGIDIFSALSESDIRAFAEKTRSLSRSPGKAFFRENDSGHELFVLASGLVSITVRGADSEEIELSRVGPGAFFGEMAILER